MVDILRKTNPTLLEVIAAKLFYASVDIPLDFHQLFADLLDLYLVYSNTWIYIHLMLRIVIPELQLRKVLLRHNEIVCLSALFR